MLDLLYRLARPFLFKLDAETAHELVFRGWCEKVEGRKIFTRGTVHAGDTLCAEATGLFVSMRPELFERLLAMRDASTTRPSS